MNPKVIRPFDYPKAPHTRRHGPDGYRHYREYRPWLRDEFSFRCVYCLWREEYLDEEQTIDHFLPKVHHPDLETNYDNLVYACRWCNRRKRTKLVPDPAKAAYADCLRVSAIGEIQALNDEGEALVRLLGLDTRNQNKRRAKILRLLRSARNHPDDPDVKATLRDFFGYPENLPDLATHKPEPPNGNKRPAGILQSHYARKRREELPEYY